MIDARRCTTLLLVVVSVLGNTTACRREHERYTAAAPETPVPVTAAPASPAQILALDRTARAAYEHAKTAYRRNDLAEVERQLQSAVERQPDFTEAWYNLGACRSELALEAVRSNDESRALYLFRTAVDCKRQAKALMDSGVWWVYLSHQEQARVRSDVENALADADEVLADERSLLAAMRIWAMAR
jgi:tetratricopeptide (TPR) repeat protein